VQHQFLQGQVVGVLSNQGACIIAKSYEMKARGVTTGMPMPIWDALPLCPDGIFIKRDPRQNAQRSLFGESDPRQLEPEEPKLFTNRSVHKSLLQRALRSVILPPGKLTSREQTRQDSSKIDARGPANRDGRAGIGAAVVAGHGRNHDA